MDKEKKVHLNVLLKTETIKKLKQIKEETGSPMGFTIDRLVEETK